MENVMPGSTAGAFMTIRTLHDLKDSSMPYGSFIIFAGLIVGIIIGYIGMVVIDSESRNIFKKPIINKKAKMSEFTHKGWFYFVPVYISFESVDVNMRTRFVDWVWPIDLVVFIHNFIASTAPHEETGCMFPIRITGKLP